MPGPGRILPILLRRSSPGEIAVVSIAVFATTILEMLGIGLILPAIKLLQDPLFVHQVSWLEDIYRRLPFASERLFATLALILLASVFVAKNAFFIFTTYLQQKFVTGNWVRFADDFLNAYINAPYAYHLSRNSADILNIVIVQIPDVFDRYVRVIVFLATDFLVFGAIFFALLFIAPLPTVITGGVICGGGLVFYLAFRNTFSRISAESMLQYRSLIQAVEDTFATLKEIAVLGRQSYYTRWLYRAHARLAALSTAHATFAISPRLGVETLAIVSFVIISLVILWGSGSGDIFSTLAVIGAAALRILPAANRILHSFNQIRGVHPVLGKVLDEFRATRAAANVPSVAAAPTAAASRIEGDIALDAVSYRYPGADRDTLSDIDLVIRKGESIGLVGRSGAGKSTLADVILGLLRPQRGHMKIDGIDIGQDINQWRGAIGYVPQTVNLVNDTIRANVAFAIEPENIDDRRVWQALTIAQLDALVKSLPDGLATVVGDRGLRFSGGQRQRLGIARALYRDPSLIVLDEATSALDSETENVVASALESLRREKTMIIIAHRLSTVRRCDRIVVLDHGRIVDVGTFDDLARRNALFRRMVETGRVDLPESAS